MKTALLGMAVGAVSGALEALLFAPRGSALSAVIVNTGLVSGAGLAGTLVILPLLVLIFGEAPRQRWVSLPWPRPPTDSAAARFASRCLVLSLSLILLFVGFYHIAHFAVMRFHHPGLTALFITTVSLGVLLFFGIAAFKGAPALERYLLAALPGGRLALLSRISPLVVPLLLIVAFLFSSKEGGGIVGFIGLLKRDELELSYLIWAMLPVGAAAGYYVFASPKGSMAETVVTGVVAGIGIGALVLASTSDSMLGPDAAAALERVGLGGRLLSAARKVTDRDGDGVAAWFGGGDCDDADPKRRPGAIDIPGNGIDEDCSGEDAEPEAATAKKSAAPSADVVKKKAADEKYSLILLTVDALRSDIGFMGYPLPITPNIDKLAQRAAVFERAYALSSYTGRSLAPMFIGRYPSETYCNYSHFTRYTGKNQMLAEALKEAGFATAGIGSHFYFEKPSGLNQGFDRYHVEIPPGPEHIDQKTTSDWVANRAIQILKDTELTRGRFFLWAHFMDPHRDYLPHRGFNDFGKKPRNLYDGEVAFTDHFLGKVLDTVTAEGLDRRTVVMVTSDHGEAFGEHGFRYHGRRLFEEIVRVPWLIAIPGHKARRIRARVSHIDLPATVYDLLGVKAPAQNRGRSLVPLIRGEETADRPIFIDQPPGEYMEEVYAFIDSGYKLIHTVQGNRFQLFNLDADPGEKTDLARQNPEALERMKTGYRQFRTTLEINAPRR